MANHRITFVPMDIVFAAGKHENILETAMRCGIHINASCGGNGTCGKCRVNILKGDVDSPAGLKMPQHKLDAGVRLACMSFPHSDVTVEIPLESQIDRSALKRKKETPHILSAGDINRLVKGWEVDPAVFKRYIELPEPSLQDNISDLDRVIREIKKRYGIEGISADFNLLTGLSSILRDAQWKVTATIALSGKDFRLIYIEPGNTEDKNYSIVIDIGTTTVCGQLLDVANCSVCKLVEHDGSGQDVCTIAESSDYNAQISYGEDVISRIMYSRKKGGLKRLKEVVAGTINKLVKELLEMSRIKAEHISHLVFAGNTTMTHLALGIDPKYIMLSPYTPAVSLLPTLRAADLGIDVGDHACAYVFPCVSSYVGGDIVAGVLGSGIFQSEKVVLFMDIGTNGEIVLGNNDWLMCASCSAGPAFEGGGIKFGIRAGRGAIEQVKINPVTFEPMILTIGRTKPLGICGSGLIDIVAELIGVGLIDQNGKFDRNLRTKRLRSGDSGYEYVLCYAPETHIGKDIVITEADVDNLIRTKAAIYAGCRVLLDSAGLSFNEIDKVIISGGFGHYIDIDKARTIGLLPELPARRFMFIGNGSLLGARLLSFSGKFLEDANRISKMMTNLELSNNSKFMDEFVAAMFLPHTDEKAFPGVIKRIKHSGQGSKGSRG